MNKKNIHIKRDEQGQSMVLIAFVLIGLLAFVGLAIDVGYFMARSAKLQSVVDSAVLAGVTELSNGTKVEADNVAVRFMHANGADVSATMTISSTESGNILGAREYALTSTWDVELFFLPLIGIDSAQVTKSATASYFPITDIATGKRMDNGAVATSYQAINGINLDGGTCTEMGDPFSPNGTPFGSYSPYPYVSPYMYRYRIMIPKEYEYDEVRVEILDPDSWSAVGNTAVYTHSVIARNMPDPDNAGNNFPYTESGNAHGDPDDADVASIYTREDTLVGDEYEGRVLTLADVNPWWFLRLDAYYVDCGLGDTNNPADNNETEFSLFYYTKNSDGTIEKKPIASYVGQKGGDNYTPPSHDTNLRWVSPGSDRNEEDQPIYVPADTGDFTVNISDGAGSDVPGIMVEPGSGTRYIYLGVRSIRGQTQNGFDLWAGPPIYYDKDGDDELDEDDVPSNVNDRNLYLVSSGHQDDHISEGIEIYAMGQLPMKSLADNPAIVPLIYVGPEYAGNTIEVDIFDGDQDTYAPIIFYFDTIAFKPDASCQPKSDFGTPEYCDGVDWNMTDWAMSFGNNERFDPDDERVYVDSALVPATPPRCRFAGGGNRTDCESRWISPAYRIEVPGDLDDCNTYALPPRGIRNTAADNPRCIPFYGGRLTAYYRAGQNDVYGWNIEMPGIPSLIH